MKLTLRRLRLSAMALLFVLAAFVIERLVEPLIHTETPMVIFLLSIIFSAWYGGMRSGLLTTLIAALLIGYFFFSPTDPGQTLELLLFILSGALISMLAGSMHTSKERFQLLMEGVQDYAIIMLDTSGHVVSWNKGAERIKGYGQGDIIGQHYSSFFLPEDVSAGEPQHILETAAETGRVAVEGWRIRRDGSSFWVSATITALRDETGQLRGFAKVTRDVTERKKAQETLLESEARMAGIINSAMDAIISVDEKQKIVLFNQAAEKIFGYSAAEMIGKPLELLLPERFRAAHTHHVENFGTTGVTRRSMHSLRAAGQLVGRRANGEEFPIEATISQLAIKSEKLYTVIVRDVTERSQVEAALLKQTNRLATLNKASRLFSETVINYNDLLQSIARYTAETVRDACMIRMVSDDGQWLEPVAFYDGDPNAYALMRKLAETSPLSVHDPLPKRVIQDGESVLIPALAPHMMQSVSEAQRPVITALGWRSWLAVPLRVQNRVVGAIHLARHQPDLPAFNHDDVLLVQDIAERAALALRNAQIYSTLEESEERYRTLVDNFPNGLVALFDHELRYIVIGGEALTFPIGLTRERLYGRTLFEAFDPEFSAPMADRYREVLAGGTFVDEVEFGGRIMLTYYIPVHNAEGKVTHGMVMAQDITERKQAEAALVESANRDAFRVRLSDALRPLSDPVEIQNETERILGQYLHANRVHYAESKEDDEDRIFIGRGYTDGVESIARWHRTSDYGPMLELFRKGRPVVINDVNSDERLDEQGRAGLKTIDVGAYVSVPLVKAGRLHALFSVHHKHPHEWTSNELTVIEEVAERTWSAVQRARAEVAVRESEERYRNLFNSIDQGFAIIQLIFDENNVPVDYGYLDLNPRFEKQTGISNAALLGGKTIRQMVPDLEEKWYQIYGQVALTGQPIRFVEESPALGRWFDVYAFRIGKPEECKVALLFSDVTERRKSEIALKKNAERDAFRVKLADALRPLADPVEIQTEASRLLGQYLNVNRVHYAESIPGDEDRIVIHRDYCDGVPSIAGWHRVSDYGPMLKYFQAGHTIVIHDRETDARLTPEERAALSAIDVGAYVAVPLVKSGHLAVIFAVHRRQQWTWQNDEVILIEDTAERTWAAVERARAEAAVRESEERYRTLFNSIDEGFALIEMMFDDDQHPVDYRFLDLNPRFGELTGLSPKEVLSGKTIREILPQLETKWFRIYGRVALTGEQVRFVEGSEAMGRWFDVNAVRIGDPREHKVAILFNDITPRKRSEIALERYAGRLKTLHEIDKAILGAVSPETIASVAVEYIQQLLPTNRSAIGIYDYETRMVRMLKVITGIDGDVQDGDEIPFDLVFGEGQMPVRGNASFPDLVHMENPLPVHQTLRDQGLRSFERFAIEGDEIIFGAISCASTEAYAFSDEHRATVNEIASQLTIAFRQALLNEKIRRHAQELEDRVHERTVQLQAVNKELESFSYSVSHDLRSPLRVIDGYSHILLEDYDGKLDEEGKFYLERMRAGTQRMGELIDDMLNLSRVTRMEIQASQFDLSDVAREVAGNLLERAPERRIEIHIQPGIEVWGDRRLLRIVLENLLGNAWKFTGKKENARIEFGETIINGVSWYYVRDNGAGFSMEYAGKLFGAFQRLHTESEFEGTGIGLATVQRIIHRHGGDIRAEGVEGQGAAFYFNLG